jgi:triosephosphate isomerase
MRQRWVMGNWKMNGDSRFIAEWTAHLFNNLSESHWTHCVLFPPAIYLSQVQALFSLNALRYGAQNVYPADSGAFTGELSGSMLREFACQYVLVGHSERRHLFSEDENFVAKKFHHVKEHDMIPVLCVGETLAQREQGLTEQVIASQLESVMQDHSQVFDRVVIAYEPVWAIGTGHTATAEQAQSVHAFIRKVIAVNEPDHAQRVSVLYGGSVNESNAAGLFSMPDIDGGLVGGASLNAQQFVEIVKCIS